MLDAKTIEGIHKREARDERKRQICDRLCGLLNSTADNHNAIEKISYDAPYDFAHISFANGRFAKAVNCTRLSDTEMIIRIADAVLQHN